MQRYEVAIVGAGPFGLSLAAHLGSRAVVFGQPMKTWKTKMPPEMLLRSAWEETSLSAPAGGGSIVEWATAQALNLHRPICLPDFLRYAGWFLSRFVDRLVPGEVEAITRHRAGFVVGSDAAGEVLARRVVVAVGVTPFPYAPPALEPLLADPRVRFAADGSAADPEPGSRVVVVGGGQAALETAALLARSTDVTVVARSAIRWFADREPHHPRGPIGGRAYRMAYPAVGYGPPPLNRIVLYPDLFARLPAPVRERVSARLLRAGGSPWLREQVRGVRLLEHATVEKVEPSSAGLHVRLSNRAELEADALLIATGYRFDLRKLRFLSPEVTASVRVDRGWPVLDRFFRSTDRDLLFVGYPAEGRFGPMSRFVLGTRFAATRTAEVLAG